MNNESSIDPPFQPLPDTRYLPIADHGLVGDCTTAALIGRNGAVSWLCVPRFDSTALFCALLDAERGGHFTLCPAQARESRQRYIPDTGVLQTEIRGPSGLVRITDACAVRAGADLSEEVCHARGELVRSVEVIDGEIDLVVECAPRGNVRAQPAGEGLRLVSDCAPDVALQLMSSHPVQGSRYTVKARRGEKLWFTLCWGGSGPRAGTADAEDALNGTIAAWRQWMCKVHYDGPQRRLVHRSALTLKMLDYSANGAIIAAPTSSLPEEIGGERNWDYRYTWIRDAAFSVYALRRIGMRAEGDLFLSWVLDIVELGNRPCVLYDLDGGVPPPERADEQLRGYRDSRPVRWGNAAASQYQHDVYGELLDCAYQWAMHNGAPGPVLWRQLEALVGRALREWNVPDQGIWEVRTAGRPYTYSAALCQVALDRGARLAERYSLAREAADWRTAAESMREAILHQAWDEKKQALTEHLGGGGLDASVLSLPLRRVLPAEHPKMVATTRAIERRLGAGNGLLFRYLTEESPDGVRGHEGAFLLCSFWLVDNYALQGRLEEAMDLYDSLCSRAGALGLLPEQIDPSTGAFLGNYPQAFSHVGVISSGINLAALEARKRER